MEIRRDKYLDLLIHSCGNGLIKQGVKEDHIIGVNLENRLNKSLRDPDALLQSKL